MKGVLLIAHGARDPAWAAPFEAVAAHLQRLDATRTVCVAFLERMAPDIQAGAAQLVERGCTHVDLVPMFLGAGGHVKDDLPPALAALRERHGGVRFEMHPPIGEIDSVVLAMATAVHETVTPQRP
jgi:sirohydrochlorin cobaltochelatase